MPRENERLTFYASSRWSSHEQCAYRGNFIVLRTGAARGRRICQDRLSPAGSDTLFACRAMRRKHAECIGDFAAETLAKAGINCAMTIAPCGFMWLAEVWPDLEEAA